MPAFEYLRPKTLAEALSLLRRGRPLAGGTSLTPGRRNVGPVVDVQALSLNRIQPKGDQIEIGAAVRLQDLVESSVTLPEVLQVAAQREAGWNLRNAATLGGTIASRDGRSPLLVALQALRPRLQLEPHAGSYELEPLLSGRPDSLAGRLIVALTLRIPSQSAYEQVARTPADVPIVCAAAVRWVGGGLSVAIGGFGRHPLLLNSEDGSDELARAAGAAYREADDAWASAAYRSEVAGILVRRAVERVGTR